MSIIQAPVDCAQKHQRSHHDKSCAKGRGTTQNMMANSKGPALQVFGVLCGSGWGARAPVNFLVMCLILFAPLRPLSNHIDVYVVCLDR
jgi:hypothetical protein